jgi:CRP/FNR family transcriptional regulator, cyclic AMP receptor protein
MGTTLELFRNETDTRSYAAGEVVFSKGDPGAAMYVVVEGEVDLRIGQELVETLGPGEPFGEMALVEHAPRIATAVARTACRVVEIPEKRFLFLVQQTPYFSLQIMRAMAERLRKMNERR